MLYGKIEVFDLCWWNMKTPSWINKKINPIYNIYNCRLLISCPQYSLILTGECPQNKKIRPPKRRHKLMFYVTHKYQMYNDSGSRAWTPLSKCITLQEPWILWKKCQIFPIQYKCVHAQLSLTRQYGFIYLNFIFYRYLVVLLPPQNMFKIFP